MRCRIGLILSLLPLTTLANSLPVDVSVTAFTTQNYPLQYSHLAHKIYLLDEVENLEEETTALFGDQPNPNAAEAQAKRWLQTESGKQFEQKLQRAYVGVTEGWKLGVMKVPAVVFQSPTQEPVVIYGQTNIATAITTYQRAQE